MKGRTELDRSLIITLIELITNEMGNKNMEEAGITRRPFCKPTKKEGAENRFLIHT